MWINFLNWADNTPPKNQRLPNKNPNIVTLIPKQRERISDFPYEH